MNAVFKTPFQEFVYVRTYARWLEDKKRREYWPETVKRYCDFMKSSLGEAITEKDYQDAYNAILILDVMPSMRALWSAGEAAKGENIAFYNCSYLVIDNIKAFSEMLYILMCFHPDTEIITDKGKKKIKDITLCDNVLTYDTEKNTYYFTNPVRVLKNPTEEFEKIELTFENGTTIICTSNHAFFTKNRGWVEAKDLMETDNIEMNSLYV